MIRPIETIYRGYRFRSRLEARWAVFFDALGIKWEYEKEGYDLGKAGWYLPDFWLPQVSMWAEVKPTKFAKIEFAKLEALVLGTGYGALMLDGEPTTRNYWGIDNFELNENGNGPSLNDYMLQEGHRYWETENRFFSSTGASFPERVGYGDDPCCLCSCCDHGGAVAKARAARFEHGEGGGRGRMKP